MTTRRRMFRLGLLVVTTALAVGLAALGASASGTKAKPITLGMVVATSGPFAGGEAPLVNGVKMAVGDINNKGGVAGRPLKLILEDTGSEQTGALNSFNRILSRDPVAIMDTTVSGFVLSQMSSIADSGLPTFTGGASVKLSRQDAGVENLFRIRTSDARVPRAAVRFAVVDLKAKKVGVLYNNNDYGNGWRNGILGFLAERGLKPAGIESYSATDKDMTPQLLRLKNAGAQVVIHSGDPPTQVIVVGQWKQLNLPYKLIVSNSGILPTTLKLIPTDASNGIYGTVDSVPTANKATKDWAARYQKRFGIPADYSAAEYYDGVQILAKAIAAKGTDKKAIVGYLRGIGFFRGIGNVYAYKGRGDGGAAVAIVKVVNGQPQLVKEVR